MIDGTHLLAALAGAGFVLAADWIRECWTHDQPFIHPDDIPPEDWPGYDGLLSRMEKELPEALATQFPESKKDC